MVELEQRPVNSTQKRESRNINTVRPYAIDVANETVIELRGISDYKWKVYEPLLNALCTPRRQIKSGEIHTTPIPYKEVKSFFPEDTPDSTIIYGDFHKLNKAFAPSGWSVNRIGEEGKKPIDAPWYLKRPDDKMQEGFKTIVKPKEPNQKKIFDRTVSEERKRMAVKQFDRLAFGTNLLHCCVSNLANPDAKKIFTNDPAQLMSDYVPPELKQELDRIIGDKTPQEYFRDRINDAVNSMRGKSYQQLSVIQQTIIGCWKDLKKQSPLVDPKTVILERFSSQPNSNNLPNLTSSPAQISPKDPVRS